MRNDLVRRGWRMRARLRVWSRHRAGPAVLVGFALLEGTVFPAPTEALLLALVLARPRRAGALAALAAVASAAGGGLGYLLGRSLGAAFTEPMLARYGVAEGWAAVAGLYADNLPLALLVSGYTPIPFLVYALAAGALGVPLLPFLGWSLVGRGLKYLLITLVARAGAPALRALLRRWGPGVAAGALAAVLLAWLLLRG